MIYESGGAKQSFQAWQGRLVGQQSCQSLDQEGIAALRIVCVPANEKPWRTESIAPIYR